MVILLKLKARISRFTQFTIRKDIIGQMYNLPKEVEIFQMIFFFNGAILSGLPSWGIYNNFPSEMEKYLLKFFLISKGSYTLSAYL